MTTGKHSSTSASVAATPVMDAAAIRSALRRLAHEIIERNPDLSAVVLAGIPSRGIEIARRLADFIHEFAHVCVDTGVLDVSMHRDDVGKRADLPVVQASHLPAIIGADLIIVTMFFYPAATTGEWKRLAPS